MDTLTFTTTNAALLGKFIGECVRAERMDFADAAVTRNALESFVESISDEALKVLRDFDRGFAVGVSGCEEQPGR